MTQEQLRERRIRLIEGAKVARPLHEAIMLFALKVWLLVGPPAFVALTTFEVAYIFAQLLPPGDAGDKIILLGALFVDLAMMFSSYRCASRAKNSYCKSAATLLLASGVNPKVVQELLSHSSISITLGMYGHVLPNMQKDVSNKMDDLFGQHSWRYLLSKVLSTTGNDFVFSAQ
jgi:integrase